MSASADATQSSGEPPIQVRSRKPSGDEAQLVALGFAAAVAQSTLIREAMGAMVGSELAWGAVLFLWLTATGLGARLGASHGRPGLARAMPSTMLILAGAGVIALRSTPALVASASGEILTTWRVLWILALAICPTAMAGGLAFPILADHRPVHGVSSGYALESTGALIGGLCFTFMLAPLGSVVAILGALGLTLASAFWFLDRSDLKTGPARRAWPRRLIAATALAVCLGLAAPAAELLAEISWSWSGRPGCLRAWQETRHQRLELSDSDPASLYADGRLVATYPDPYLTVPRTHLIMLLHPEPRRTLVAGGLADGSVTTILDHPVTHLEIVEDDPALPAFLSRWYGKQLSAALADERAHLGSADPLRAVRAGGSWDLVLLLGSNPINLRANRTRTSELLETCRRSLAPGGRLVLSLEAGDTYLGGLSGRLIEITAATLGESFDQVQVVPAQPMLLVASTGATRPIPEVREMERRWKARAITDPVFVPEMLPLLLDRPRARTVEELIERITSADPGSRYLNTFDRPRAVLVAAALSEGRGHPGLVTIAQALDRLALSNLSRRPIQGMVIPAVLALALATAAAALTGRARERAAGLATAAVVGCGSMGWWLILLVAWQATRGAVYSEVGALAAAFMAGLAAGSSLAARLERAHRLMPWLMSAAAALSMAIAGGVERWIPIISIPALLVAGGLLSGAAFCGAAGMVGRRTRVAAGSGFAADELGAACGSLVIGLLAIPLIGLRVSALGLAALQLATVPGLAIHSRLRAPSRHLDQEPGMIGS